MRVAILGLGVIGTTYAYAFQKAGHETFHIVREGKKDIPAEILVRLLDGRYNSKGEEKQDNYKVALAKNNEEYDFIIVSVASGKLEAAINTIRERNIKGTIVLFCNFWNERKEIEKIIGNLNYVTAFPTAGGHMNSNGVLDCVLFDHIMLESREKANIANYTDLLSLLNSADIKQEIPHDMFEWIWIHMAINAGVTSTAGRNGELDNPNQLAKDLMSDSKSLSLAVKSIRETVKTVEARGVDLSLYKNELLPYKIPAGIAGIAMKKLFSSNELTSRIMTLHNDVNDILYGCKCVYDEGKKQGLQLPLFYENMEKIMS
ncbi:2-dehydropantoate 2-reductase [Pseudobutyrivibrio sp. YE44]|uniref:ketopantoate reductase family protein n=1 Tax=Pseudobutyrivibrio sp. YE44 TaxID=1520802 RepID=UPI000884764A|nr:2-dehydropantoate 2-reductase N-terminal domain-containing protein [Pseudobutyrivibrio sp. YE44]SDB13681.1 2-dehydropantoate 2-reductase [Pseudobutyrivibrio sp. YE44]